MKPTLEQIKTDESVWPEGADFYIPESGITYAYFIKKIGSDLVYKLADFPDNWARHKSEIPLRAIPRPTKSFVPEVGVECEILCDYILCGARPLKVNQGQIVKVHSIVDLGFGDVALISDLETKGTGTIIFSQLSPIKSEREKFIELVGSKQLLGDMSVNDLAGALYDAGCCFMESTK